jgi:hypothetical protein
MSQLFSRHWDTLPPRYPGESGLPALAAFALRPEPWLALLLGVALLQQWLAWDLSPWIYDQSRDALWAERIASGEAFPAHGPVAGAGDAVYLGPAYYYLGALFYLAGVPPWLWPRLLVTATTVAALYVAWRLPLGSRRAALIGVGLWQSDATLAPIARMATNPAWVPLIAVVLLAVLAGLPQRGGRAALWRVAAAIGLWAVALQLHLAALFWAPALLAALALVPRGSRLAAVITATLTSVLGIAALLGGWRETLQFLLGLAQKRADLVQDAAHWYSRSLSWLVLHWQMAQWWRRNGVLSDLAAAGVAAHWLAVLVGVAAGVSHLARSRGPQRRWAMVLLVWTLSGLVLLPLVSPALAFYYLLAVLPAPYLWAGVGLASRQWATAAAVVAIGLSSVGVAQMNHDLRDRGEFLAPPGSLWWVKVPEHFPLLAHDLEALRLLRNAGIGYECAVQQVHGRLWVNALVDGGYLASRWLADEHGTACQAQLLWLGADGVVHLDGSSGDVQNSPPPLPVVPVEPRHPLLLALRPFSGTIELPGDGRARWLTAYATARPETGCPGLQWQHVGFSRYFASLDGRAPCRLEGQGQAVWIDIEAPPLGARL